MELFGSTREFAQFTMPDAAGRLALDIRLSGLSGVDFQAGWPRQTFASRSSL
jgi:FixJ family two-component response regulator